MDEYRAIWTARTMVESQIAEVALREAGIPCIVENLAADPYDGLWVLQRGWGRIRVQQKDAQRAQGIIEEALATRPSEDGSEGQEGEGPVEEP